MQKIELAIGRLLITGVIVSFLLMLTGGLSYLWTNGNNIVHYEFFHKNLIETRYLNPLGIIQIGLYALVITQFLRVCLIAWFFLKTKDNIFFCISGFIACVLAYSLAGVYNVYF